MTGETKVRASHKVRVETILQAASRLIATEGAHGVHMERVAREAGVSKGLVHYYFSTRTELLRQTIAYSDRQCDARLREQLAGLATARERLERLLLSYVDNEAVFAENRALWNAAWGALRLDPELAPDLIAAYRGISDQVEELIVAGSDDGSVAAVDDPAETSISLMALAEGLSSLYDADVVGADEAARLIRRAVATELGA